MVIVTELRDSGFAAIEGDCQLGTFVEKALATAKEDFALQATIPIIQNEKRRSKAQEPRARTPQNGDPEKAVPTHTRPAHYVVVRNHMEVGIDVLETIVSPHADWSGLCSRGRVIDPRTMPCGWNHIPCSFGLRTNSLCSTSLRTLEKLFLRDI